jgi:hypothetical protein
MLVKKLNVANYGFTIQDPFPIRNNSYKGHVRPNTLNPMETLQTLEQSGKNNKDLNFLMNLI